MKAGLIDITNSTNISRYKSKISVVELAKCIVKIKNIDERIKAGDPEVVHEIARCNGKINLFSFASKYCCYHNKNIYGKDDYSILDTILKESLPRYFDDITYRVKQINGKKVLNIKNIMITLLRNLMDQAQTQILEKGSLIILFGSIIGEMMNKYDYLESLVINNEFDEAIQELRQIKDSPNSIEIEKMILDMKIDYSYLNMLNDLVNHKFVCEEESIIRERINAKIQENRNNFVKFLYTQKQQGRSSSQWCEIFPQGCVKLPKGA